MQRPAATDGAQPGPRLLGPAVTPALAAEALRMAPLAPKDAFAPPNIEIVRICENKIRNVRLPPPSLLTTLVELHLDNNRIMELPDAFIDFESLEVLSLSSNGFVDMPDVVLELDTLKQLLMEQNAMWSASLSAAPPAPVLCPAPD